MVTIIVCQDFAVSWAETIKEQVKSGGSYDSVSEYIVTKVCN